MIKVRPHWSQEKLSTSHTSREGFIIPTCSPRGAWTCIWIHPKARFFLGYLFLFPSTEGTKCGAVPGVVCGGERTELGDYLAKSFDLARRQDEVGP